MPVVPLATLSPVHRRRRAGGSSRARGRLILWMGGVLLGMFLYLGVHAFWNWKHVLSSSGGRYFVHRIEIPVPAFQQNDPRWADEPLGQTTETVGDVGCALTSAAMVLASYGIDTDPERLNAYLATHGGYTDQGYIYWEKACEIAPDRVEKAYEDMPSYALIDQNLLAGNPVIVRLTLRNGTPHFVVVVGKQGWDYLTRDPARPAAWGVYPLRELTPRIEGLRFYRMLTPALQFSAPVSAATTISSPTNL